MTWYGKHGVRHTLEKIDVIREVRRQINTAGFDWHIDQGTKWMLKQAIAICGIFLLTGCGAAYIPSKVSDANGKVRIVSLNSESVLAANRSTYRPKQLPAVFFQNAGGPSAGRGVGALPEPTLDRPQRPADMDLRLPPPAQNSPYEIGVGDVLLLATRDSANTIEELSGLLAAQNRRQGYTVQDDGAIAIPDVGRVNVVGLTLEEAEARLFQRLLENQIDPTFSLEIAEFNSKRVSIGGAVGNATVVPLTLTPLTLDQALSAAGGIRAPDMDYASIRIYRDQTLYQVPLDDYLARGDLQKIRLIEGDSVFVDTEYQLDRAQAYFSEQITIAQFRQNARIQALNELQAEVNLRRAALNEARSNYETQVSMDAVDRDYVYLTGEVTNPSRFILPLGRQASLADALYSEGGFSLQTGNPAQIYVIRKSPDPRDFGAVTAWHLDASNAVNLTVATSLELRPNDVIFVASQPVANWNRAVSLIIPSLVTSAATRALN